MTRNEVLKKVIEVINEHRPVGGYPEAVENSKMTFDLGMDSLDIAESILDIETRLNVHFDDDDHEKVKYDVQSVKDLVDLICKKLNITTNDVQKRVEKTVAKPQNPELEKLKGVDLSKLVGKPVQLNGYEIVVRKIAETKQIKR